MKVRPLNYQKERASKQLNIRKSLIENHKMLSNKHLFKKKSNKILAISH